jgi:putative transposase
VKKSYHVISHQGKTSERYLAAFFQENGQQLLPLVELIEQCRLAVDEVIQVLGRQTIETILEVSATQIAGPRMQGKSGGEVSWYGSQQGRVRLKDRKLIVSKPRLRRKGRGAGKEVPIPAYEALQESETTGARMLETMLRGVSTRQYEHVIPEMAETVGVSRSSVSREAIEAAETQLKELLERDWSQTDLLVIYIDGMRFGSHHVLSAVGVDSQGRKHVLGLQDGASENTEAVKGLLCHLRDRGVGSDKRYLFVIDGAKALRAAIKEVYGAKQPVQRCRTHKMRNVIEQLPQEQQAQTKAVIKAAYRLDADKGMAKMKQLADWLAREWPQAAASLLEGLEETFTINSLGVPPSLHRCLGTTNIIESPQSGVRMRTGRVSRWKDGAMVRRWVASAFLITEKSFRKVVGYQELWALATILGRDTKTFKQEVA